MFEIDYNKMLSRIESIVEENGGERNKIADDLIDQICYCNGAELETAYDFCEYYSCSLDYLVGRSDVYSVI